MADYDRSMSIDDLAGGASIGEPEAAGQGLGAVRGLDGYDAQARALSPDGLPSYAETRDAMANLRVDRAGMVSSTPTTVEHVIDHTLSAAQIGELSSGGTHDNAGLTVGRLRLSVSTTPHTEPSGDGVRFWLSDAQANPRFETMTVYIASDYAEGSCEYDVTLEHELEHVDDNNRLITEYAERMRQALVAAPLPTQSAPIEAADRAAGDLEVERTVRAAIGPVYSALRQALQEATAARDTPESYLEIGGRCENW